MPCLVDGETGWRQSHRRHAGLTGRRTTRREEWDFYLLNTGDRYLATSGNFFTATDNHTLAGVEIVSGREVRERGRLVRRDGLEVELRQVA